MDEARACAALVEELGLSREEVGLRVGRSRVAVSNLIRLLELPDEALELIERGALTEGHGRALLLTDDHTERRKLARDAAEGRWSVRELEVPGAGAATGRSGRSPSSPRRRPASRPAAAVERSPTRSGRCWARGRGDAGPRGGVPRAVHRRVTRATRSSWRAGYGPAAA